MKKSFNELEKFRSTWSMREQLAYEMFNDIKNRDRLETDDHYENPVLDVLYSMLDLCDDETDRKILDEYDVIDIFDEIQELVEKFVDNFEVRKPNEELL